MRRAICLMGVLGSGLYAGCGGGGDSTSEAPTPTAKTPSKISKADFIKKGDQLCAQLNAVLGSISDSDSSAAAEDLPDYYQGLMIHLRALGTPDDKTGLRKVFDAGDDVASAKETAEKARLNGDDAGEARAEAEASSARSRFVSAARSYGFNECGRVPAGTGGST